VAAKFNFLLEAELLDRELRRGAVFTVTSIASCSMGSASLVSCRVGSEFVRAGGETRLARVDTCRLTSALDAVESWQRFMS